nr:unnamed protein product [Callosobruchus chinensis]
MVARQYPTICSNSLPIANVILSARIGLCNKQLIGTGYANHNYLLIPLLAPNTAEYRRHNSSHIKTRNPIERLFGVQKRRFPILLYGCRLKVETFLNICNCGSYSST